MYEKRYLGKTNMLINRVGLGGIPIQRVNIEEAKEIINHALDLGVNFIDSARGYTISESFIGESLGARRKDIYLATKSMARSYEQMEKDINISLNNFKTDYIDLYQMHNIKSKDEFLDALEDEGCYRALAVAKEKGLIKHIGITSHSQDFLKWLLNSEYCNYVETIQFPFNFIEDNGLELLSLAKEKGLGTIAMKPLGGGAIDKGSIAIKWLLNQSNLDIAIPGIGAMREADDLFSVKDFNYTNEEIDYMNNLKANLKDDFCHRCGYCMPCTKGIDIPGTFTLERYYLYYGLKDWAQMRYDTAKVLPSACINCGACVKRCPYNLDIPNKLQKIVKLFEEK